MGTDIAWDEDNYGCTLKIARAWRRMKPKLRPTHPKLLMRILRDIYQYPYPDFIHNDDKCGDTFVIIDEIIDQIFNGIKRLSLHLPRSTSWNSLQYIVNDRLPICGDNGKLDILLDQLQLWAEHIESVPLLRDRPGKQGPGRREAQPHLRVWVKAIFWYVLNVEDAGANARFSYDHKTKTANGRMAHLCRVTLSAMGFNIDDSALFTELRNARGDKLIDTNFWDLIPSLPPINPQAS